MAIKYLGSSNVKMFPSAYRGQSVDAEAYFTTEGNLTKAETLGFASKSFVEEYDGTNITIVIKGYRFDTTKAAIEALAGSGDEEIYADITVVAKGADGTFNTLTCYGGSQVVLDDGTYFKGLAFSSDSTDLTSSAILVLENVEGTWGVPSASRLNVSPSQIRTSDTGADKDKSLLEKIVTNTIVSTSTTTQGLSVTQNASISGSTTTQDLSVTQDASISGSLNITETTTCLGGMNSALQYGNYVVCSTAANVANKEITISNLSSFEVGMHLHILFVNENTAANPKLIINGQTGSQYVFEIRGKDSDTQGYTNAYDLWDAGSVVDLVLAMVGSGLTTKVWLVSNWRNSVYLANNAVNTEFTNASFSSAYVSNDGSITASLVADGFYYMYWSNDSTKFINFGMIYWHGKQSGALYYGMITSAINTNGDEYALRVESTGATMYYKAVNTNSFLPFDGGGKLYYKRIK